MYIFQQNKLKKNHSSAGMREERDFKMFIYMSAVCVPLCVCTFANALFFPLLQSVTDHNQSL